MMKPRPCFIVSVVSTPLLYWSDVLQVAIPDITEATKGAKILVFVIPHQFIHKICDQIKPHLTEGTIGISLIKVGSRDLVSR